MTHTYEAKAVLLHADAGCFVNEYLDQCSLKMDVETISKAKSILRRPWCKTESEVSMLFVRRTHTGLFTPTIYRTIFGIVIVIPIHPIKKITIAFA